MPPVADEPHDARDSAPGAIPTGLDGARVLSGELLVAFPDGRTVGKVRVEDGWYLTPLGYDRLGRDTGFLESQIQRAQARAESCAQLAEATCSAVAARHAGYSAPTVAAFSVFSLLLGVALGWLGLLVRRSHPPPAA